MIVSGRRVGKVSASIGWLIENPEGILVTIGETQRIHILSVLKGIDSKTDWNKRVINVSNS